MAGYEVLLEETATPEEVDAIQRLLSEAGLEAEARAAYARRSVGELPWVVMLSMPFGIFAAAFLKSYGENLGEHAADSTAEAARHVRAWITSVYAARPGEGHVLLDDTEHNVQVLLDADLTQEAAEALFEVDPATDGGDAGQLRWDPQRRWHPPF